MTRRAVTAGFEDTIETTMESFEQAECFTTFSSSKTGSCKASCLIADLLRAGRVYRHTMVETQRDVLMLSRRMHQILSRMPITLQPDAGVTEAIQPIRFLASRSSTLDLARWEMSAAVMSSRPVPPRELRDNPPRYHVMFPFEPDMNDKRRKIIHAQRQRLEALKVKVEELKAEAESIRGELETVRDDEQEAFDKMSASQQSGERGESTEASIDNLDTAISALDEIEDLSDLVEAIEALDDAENG
jgi:hypothetical protein